MNRVGKEKILHGVAVSPGVSIGVPHHFAHEVLDIDESPLPESAIEAEIAKFKAALSETKTHIANDLKIIRKKGSSEASKIFHTHLMILNDEILISEIQNLIISKHFSAAYAVNKIMKDYQLAFENMDNNYFSQRAFDIEDVCRRIVRNILNIEKGICQYSTLQNARIIVAQNIFPSDTVSFNKKNVIAIVTELGGQTSHASILARSLEVPAITGVHGITEAIKKASIIIVDGHTGQVIINPTGTTLQNYKEKELAQSKRLKDDLKTAKLKSVTLDNTAIQLCANIQTAGEIDNVIKWHSEGIGLFRTEFLLEEKAGLLTEDEQYAIYEQAASKITPNTLSIRLLDIGGDKLQDHLIYKEENPYLGIRGVRLLLKNPDLLKTQIRAILRASKQKNIRVMVPFVTMISEMEEIIELFDKEKKALAKKGCDFNENLKIGTMIEIPSAALLADHLAKIVDFFSIGTNDLTQYTLAADRGSERVAYIFESCNPAVIKLIKMSVDAANKQNIPVSICGEMAGDPLVVPLLLGLGVRSLSVTPFLIPEIKKIIRVVKVADCKELAEKVLSRSRGTDVVKDLTEFFNTKINQQN